MKHKLSTAAAACFLALASFGASAQVTDQQIREFFATNPTPEQIAAAAASLGMNESQISSAMSIGGYGGDKFSKDQAARDKAINEWVSNQNNGYNWNAQGQLVKSGAAQNAPALGAAAFGANAAWANGSTRVCPEGMSIALSKARVPKCVGAPTAQFPTGETDVNALAAQAAGTLFSDKAVANGTANSSNTSSQQWTPGQLAGYGGGSLGMIQAEPGKVPGVDGMYGPDGKWLSKEEIKAFYASGADDIQYFQSLQGADLGSQSRYVIEARTLAGAGTMSGQAAIEHYWKQYQTYTPNGKYANDKAGYIKELLSDPQRAGAIEKGIWTGTGASSSSDSDFGAIYGPGTGHDFTWQQGGWGPRGMGDSWDPKASDKAKQGNYVVNAAPAGKVPGVDGMYTPNGQWLTKEEIKDFYAKGGDDVQFFQQLPGASLATQSQFVLQARSLAGPGTMKGQAALDHYWEQYKKYSPNGKWALANDKQGFINDIMFSPSTSGAIISGTYTGSIGSSPADSDFGGIYGPGTGHDFNWQQGGWGPRGMGDSWDPTVSAKTRVYNAPAPAAK